MSVVIVGVQILFGAMRLRELPVLPIGYRYVIHSGTWVLASVKLDNELHRFYVSNDGVLYRQGLAYDGQCRECGRAKTQFFIDTDTTIQLPQKQLTWNQINS